MNATRRLVRSSVPLAMLFVSACGTNPGPEVNPEGGGAVAAADFFPGPILPPPPIPITSPQINSPPRDAVVGQGAGVRFSVGVGGLSPFTFRWHKNGSPIPGASGAGPSLTIASAGPSDAANYMVLITDGFGHTATASARLEVMSRRWAQLSGRSTATTPNLQQPSLTLCGQPHVAHLVPSANGGSQLFVRSFDGAVWSVKGAALNVNGDASASDPSIACVSDATGAWPVVAWSEGTATGRNIYVRYWNGTAWQSSGGALNIAAGSTAVKPVLRVPPYDPNVGNVPTEGITRRAAVAWIENGRPSARRWDSGWQLLTGGSQIPSAGNATDIALKIDLEYQNRYPLVVAWIQAEGGTGRPYVALYTGTPSGNDHWTLLGDPASIGNPPLAAQAGRIGIATGKLALPGLGSPALAVPVVLLADAGAVLTSFYPGASYLQLMGLQAWPEYGSFSLPRTVRAVSLDGDELPRLSCMGRTVPTFGLVVSDATGFEVRNGTCSDPVPVRWTAVRPRFDVPLEEASLRMSSATDPLVAGTSYIGGGRYELSVWRYYD